MSKFFLLQKICARFRVCLCLPLTSSFRKALISVSHTFIDWTAAFLDIGLKLNISIFQFSLKNLTMKMQTRIDNLGEIYCNLKFITNSKHAYIQIQKKETNFSSYSVSAFWNVYTLRTKNVSSLPVSDKLM